MRKVVITIFFEMIFLIINPIDLWRVLKIVAISAFDQKSNMQFLRNEFSKFSRTILKHVACKMLTVKFLKLNCLTCIFRQNQLYLLCNPVQNLTPNFLRMKIWDSESFFQSLVLERCSKVWALNFGGHEGHSTSL